MMKNLLLLVLIYAFPIFLTANPCPDDTTPPVITSKGSIWDCTFNVFDDSDTNFINVTEESECGIRIVEIADWDIIKGNCEDPFMYKYTIIWYAEDVAGNSTNFTQEITISRPQPEEIIFPKDTMVQCPSYGYESFDAFGYPTIGGKNITDLCGFRVQFKLLDTLSSLAQNQCLTEVRKEWTLMSNCNGLVVKDTQAIILIDTIRPIIACSALEDTTTLMIDPETCCAIYTFPLADAVDFCASDDELNFRYRIDGTITGSEVALKAGLYEGSIIVTDPCNNADTCNYAINILDGSAPIIDCSTIRPVQLTNASQDIGVTDLGLNAKDCSGEATILYRFSSQSVGDEGEAQTFTCDMVGTAVNIIAVAEDMDGNISEEQTCTVLVSAVSDVCPVRKTLAPFSSGRELITRKDHELVVYHNGLELNFHSDEGVRGFKLYAISGKVVWERSWEDVVFEFSGILPGQVKDGIYILKVKKINDQHENVKVAIF